MADIGTEYNRTWFENRAIQSLSKMSDHVWDYSDSLLLYTPSGSDTYKKLQETDTPYFRLVTHPEREYLASIAERVVSMLPDNFEYIDLGPGTEHKEQFFFDEIKRQGKRCTYVPVDISDHFLAIAKAHAESQDIEVLPLKISFEELPAFLGSPTTPRFVSLGLTFSNFAPQEALQLLKAIAGKGGYVFINTQIRDRVDMIGLQKVYQEDAVHIADEKVKFLGLDPITDISARTADDGFRVWCMVLRTNQLLRDVGVEEGDKLMVFQSLRYTKEQLQEELQESAATLLDTGSSFIASVIKV